MSTRANIAKPSELAASIRKGDRRSLARALTAVENRVPGFEDLLDELYPSVGSAWRLGLTGPPGVGKSTISARLIDHFVTEGKNVAYLAVDPSSPFSGGAVLGDRIRVDGDTPGDVFVRSVATRGAHGGLSRQTECITDVLDAAGFDIVLVESVGVGQAELDIASVVDTVVVVLVPESGDEVQAMKAGLLEIADILCVNKADRASADSLYSALKHSLTMRSNPDHKKPAVTRTKALQAGGIANLVESAVDHRRMLEQSGEWSRLRDQRLRRRVEAHVRSIWEARFWTGERLELLRNAMVTLDTDARRPYSLASRIIDPDVSE